MKLSKTYEIFREGINAGKRKDQGGSGWTKNRQMGKRGKQKVLIMCKQAPGQYTCLVIAAVCSLLKFPV